MKHLTSTTIFPALKKRDWVFYFSLSAFWFWLAGWCRIRKMTLPPEMETRGPEGWVGLQTVPAITDSLRWGGMSGGLGSDPMLQAGPASKIKAICSGLCLVELWRSLSWALQHLHASQRESAPKFLASRFSALMKKCPKASHCIGIVMEKIQEGWHLQWCLQPRGKEPRRGRDVDQSFLKPSGSI